ncbi:MAG: hypothetical protein J6J36_00605 [Clostridia bacterium]|nr:hypothetical protein [Clostridia bacterium]
MGILEKHLKGKYRFELGDLIMYHPTQEQIEYIEDYIGSMKIENGELILDMTLLRYILENLTSIGGEVLALTDEELNENLDRADYELEVFIDEVKRLIREISDRMIRQTIERLDEIKKIINSTKALNEYQEINEELDKIVKEKGSNASINDLIEKDDEIKKLIKENEDK